MLVYANQLAIEGANAEPAIFRAVGAWLKEQLGFGLHPAQLTTDGDYAGYRNTLPSRLRVCATKEDQNALYAWVLKNQDDDVHGRQWITEVGLKARLEAFEFSCVVRTEEQSTLVGEPVTASQPRIIRYIANNIGHAAGAGFAKSVPGVMPEEVGQGANSCEDLLNSIERSERTFPILLVSPTRDGSYLLNVKSLQERLIGLAQVVRVLPECDTYQMESVLGRTWSAWGGAINMLYAPNQRGQIRTRLFLPEEILGWGTSQITRASRVLAWVTNKTNAFHLWKHIRPEGVTQLALRRRLQAVGRQEMDASQLRLELERVSKVVAEQSAWVVELENDNSAVRAELSEAREQLREEFDRVKQKDFVVQSLKSQLENAGGGRASTSEAEKLLKLACRPMITPVECLEAIESLYSNRCIVLESARASAKETNHFAEGRRLLEMLRTLVTDYRDKLIDGGDSEARKCFGKSDYAAKESDTVMKNKASRRQRTFDYLGEPVEMFRHLKIGVDDNAEKTIRVHFHWDGDRRVIVIGHCGKHLFLPSR